MQKVITASLKDTAGRYWRAEVPERPAGLELLNDYVDAREEETLVASIDALPWNVEWKRRRQLYGVGYDRSAAAPFPDFLEALAERLRREGILDRPAFGSAINDYLPGQGISAHHDRAWFGEPVVSLSLLSAVTMEFREAQRSDARVDLDLPRRSLLVLRGEARWVWLHGIAGRQSDRVGGLVRSRGRRVSITLRVPRRTGDRAEFLGQQAMDDAGVIGSSS